MPTAPTRMVFPDDLRSAVVVFLVAVPLCLGIALASGAPLLSGLIAGIVGGLVVSLVSGSHMMVSGPAAGLSAIVAAAIADIGSFEAFCVAVVIAGIGQLILGVLRLGVISFYFPSSVIKGMLAAIGIIVILKQLPHAVGYDADTMGDEAFRQSTGENTFTAIAHALERIEPGALVISALGLAIMVTWERPWAARLRTIPAGLTVVLVALALNALFGTLAPAWTLGPSHLVQLPGGDTPGAAFRELTLPAWGAITNPVVWRVAVTLAIVASLETLLSLDATNKMDPLKREAPANRELIAQGVGNTLSGLLGGLPMTGVIVRTAANVSAGAKTRWSSFTHGVFLLLALLAVPGLLNRIPLAALAAILIFTGWKLAHPRQLVAAWRVGRSQVVPFAGTIVAILFTDLLVGIAIGMVIGIAFILFDQLKAPAWDEVSPAGAVLRRVRLHEQVTFLNKAGVLAALQAIPPGSRIEIDARQTAHLDHDVREALLDFRETARSRGIDYRLVGIPEPAAGGGAH